MKFNDATFYFNIRYGDSSGSIDMTSAQTSSDIHAAEELGAKLSTSTGTLSIGTLD